MEINISEDDLKKLRKLQMVELELLDVFSKICEEYNLSYYMCYGSLLGAVRHKGFIPWDDDIDVVMPRVDFEKLTQLAPNVIGRDYSFQYYNTDKNYLDISAKLRKNSAKYIPAEHKLFDYISYGCWIDIFPLDNLSENGSFIYYLQSVINIKFINRLVHHRMMKINKSMKLKTKLMICFTKILPAKFWFNIRDGICKCDRNDNSKYVSCFSIPYSKKKAVYLRSSFGTPQKMLFEGKYYNVPERWEDILKCVYGNYMSIPPFEERTFKHEAVEWS